MADVYEILNSYEEIQDIEARPPTQVKQLVFDNIKIHLMYDVIYYGLITTDAFAEDKA